MRTLWLVVFVFVGAAVAVQASSGGPPAGTVVSQDGCTCHSGQPNPGTVVNVAHPASYLGASKHAIRITSSTDVTQNPAGNKGGFLAWVSHGTFAKRAGSEDWYQIEELDGRSVIKHNLNGDSSNSAQEWRFDWIPPTSDVGPVTLKVWVNRVNGDGSASGLDHWNRKSAMIDPQPHGDPGTTSGTAATTPASTTARATQTVSTTGTGTRTETGTVVSDPAFTLPLVLGALVVAFVLYRRR